MAEDGYMLVAAERLVVIVLDSDLSEMAIENHEIARSNRTFA